MLALAKLLLKKHGIKVFLETRYKGYTPCKIPSFWLFQAQILAADIRQCPAKNRVISDKRCFTMDTVVQREVNFVLRYPRLKTLKHSVSMDLSCPSFSFNEHFNGQFAYIHFPAPIPRSPIKSLLR